MQVEAKSSDWILATEVDGVRTWQLKADPKTTAALQDSKFKTFDDVKKHEVRKKDFLRIFGITDYITASFFKRKSDLVITGSYMNAAGDKVFFREIHSPRQQLLFTSGKTIPEYYEAEILK